MNLFCLQNIQNDAVIWLSLTHSIVLINVLILHKAEKLHSAVDVVTRSILSKKDLHRLSIENLTQCLNVSDLLYWDPIQANVRKSLK